MGQPQGSCSPQGHLVPLSRGACVCVFLDKDAWLLADAQRESLLKLVQSS